VTLDLDALRTKLAATTAVRVTGRVVSVTGLTVRMTLPGARVGDVVLIRRPLQPLPAEIVGFDEGAAIALPLGPLTGIGVQDEVESTGRGFSILVGEGLLGRVLDGLGQPLDQGPLAEGLERLLVERQPPRATERRPISQPLATGVKVIDSILTLGVGQRVGLFAGSGVGKSVLLGSIARWAHADVIVVALVGERGREVGEFLSRYLGPEGLKRAVVVVATSDAPALERLRAAEVATAIAEYFRDQEREVLLLVDSITRVARAQREIGLAAGEPPTRRGYPPSTFAMLPRLLERSGQSATGSISAIYTVLVEGGDMDEPIADEVRGIVDGHIVLDRNLAARGHYPAVDVQQSLSRVMPLVTAPEHRKAAALLRELIAAYEARRDLILLGAYQPGTDPAADRAIAIKPELDAFLAQGPDDFSPWEATLKSLFSVASRA
jgi:type III secretion protein N (ATPase)